MKPQASTTDKSDETEPAYSGLLDITDSEFDAFRRLIYETTGISLSDGKRALVCSRLSKRLRQLGLASYRDYYELLRSGDETGLERQQMINCITTNKTDFFREPHHFEFLRDKLFTIWRDRAQRTGQRRLRIWSAACSTGEEPYTIAMTLLDHFGPLAAWDAKILATDIDTQVLERAERGAYDYDRVEGLEPELVRRHFLRGLGQQAGLCRVRSELQRLIAFRQLNFVDEVWPVRTKFDAIFCRNVLIYFNRQTQQRIVDRLTDHLAPGGHLFLGHSENADWLSRRLTILGQTIYRPRTAEGAERVERLLDAVEVSQFAKGDVSKRPAAAIQAPTRNIVAGEIFASREPVEVRTTLGSCIAACLFDPEARIGGMNHFVLPDRVGERLQAQSLGVHAMELLINRIMSLGGDRRRLRAKLFGGAQMFAIDNPHWQVGEKNVAFIRQFCQTEQIPIEAQQLGGTQALVVKFRTDSGKALVKAIDRKTLERIDPAEETNAKRLREQVAVPAGEVTLF